VNGPWSASTGQMVNTADSGWSWFQRSNTDPNLELRFVRSSEAGFGVLPGR
jgi:hypothetical protein